jgi:hypothetical protein
MREVVNLDQLLRDWLSPAPPPPPVPQEALPRVELPEPSALEEEQQLQLWLDVPTAFWLAPSAETVRPILRRARERSEAERKLVAGAWSLLVGEGAPDTDGRLWTLFDRMRARALKALLWREEQEAPTIDANRYCGDFVVGENMVESREVMRDPATGSMLYDSRDGSNWPY